MKLFNYVFKLIKSTTQIPFTIKSLFESTIKTNFTNQNSPIPSRKICKTQCTSPLIINPLLENLVTERKFKTNVTPALLHKNCSILFNKIDTNPSRKRQLKNYQQGRRPKTPDLIYIPHIIRWLRIKIQLKYLKKAWDPEFSEGAFIYGATKALSQITKIIHRDKPDDLEGLLTTMAMKKLKKDMSVKLSKLQKLIIEIQPEDIKILVPLKVDLKMHGDFKECTISLRSLALKWFDDREGLNLVLVALQTEFVRDYTEGSYSEWTINKFEVLECGILKEPPRRAA